MLILLLLLILIEKSLTFEKDVDNLFKILIENLREDPNLKNDHEFTEVSREFIDKQIRKFMDLVSEYDEQSRPKRNVPEEENLSRAVDSGLVGHGLKEFNPDVLPASAAGIIKDLQPYFNVPGSFIKDMKLFQQNSKTYFITLESASPENEYASFLVIRQYKENNFLITVRREIYNGIRVATFPMENSTIIIVAENGTHEENHIPIYEFNESEQMDKIQKLNVPYLTDVVIWEDKQNIFMCGAQFLKETGNGTTFEVEMPLYQWRGRHFDIIQSIKGYGVRRITPFSIGSESYLAIANSRNDDDNGKMYSEVLKYNLQAEKYEEFQRLLTNACTDIKYYTTSFNGKEEHFIITAVQETGNTGIESNGYDISSVIYKFIDNYFIPFQSVPLRGVKEWQPVPMENGNVILLASTMDGLQCLQYDGWRFETCNINFPNATFGEIRVVNAIHFYKFEDKLILAIISEDKKKNLFEMKASFENQLKNEYEQLLVWCRNSIRELDDMTNDVVGDPLRGDMLGDIDDMESGAQHDASEEEKLLHAVTELERKMANINEKLQNALRIESDHIIDYDLNVTTIVIENNADFEQVKIETINDIAIQNVVDKTLNINNGFEIKDIMKFVFVRTEESIFPKTINGYNLEDIVKTDSVINLNTLIVNGTATFKPDLNVTETINGIVVNNNNLLLNDTIQSFGNFSINSIIIDNLTLDSLDSIEVNITNDELIKNVKLLKVKNLTIARFLNGVDIPTLHKFALRNSGDQNITGIYYVDSMSMDHLQTEFLSDYAALEDFVHITQGNYTIDKDVRFYGDINVNKLKASEYLNTIPVVEGKLDVLLKNATEQQYVPSIKSLENLELLRSIDLRGKLIGKAFDLKKPLVTIDTDVEVVGDAIISGDVQVEGTAKADDVVSHQEEGKSFQKLQKDGLKLTDAEIPNHLEFLHHLNVEDVFADRINNIDPNSWVVNGAKQTQVVKGRKKFQGDLEITGNANVFRINDIDMGELETNVLKKDGDQVITGKHYVKYIYIQKRILPNNTIFGPNPWKDVVTATGDQVISGTITFLNNLTASSISANNIEVKGAINGQDVARIYKDAVTKDSAFKVQGYKTFDNITIENLEINKNFTFLSQLNSDVLHVPNLSKLDTIIVKNINFNLGFNGVDNTDLQNVVTDENMEFNIDGDYPFENITVFGNVYVKSNRINDLHLDDLVNNSVKIDEPCHFEYVEFAQDVFVNNTITLEGQVENLDLDNVFQNEPDIQQIVIDEKVFRSEVIVLGKLYINETLNNINYPKLCKFISTDEKDPKLLRIKGNALFVKGPHVRKLNDDNLVELENNLWFTDEPVTIGGSIKFEGDVNFSEDVRIEGDLNDVNLEELSSKYLSKTKQQNVSAILIFVDGINFQDDVACPQLFVQGKINNIKFDEFVKNVLLNRSQVFEEPVYFENCTTEDVQGDYLVNNLNLENDVLRYDKPNLVTGAKQFQNLNTDVLRIDKKIYIQGVDVRHWLTNAISTTGTFQIQGKTLFKNATLENGLSLMGNFNNLRFNEETILLKHLPQNITGRKSFMHEISGEMKFKALKVKGLVNNADIGELVQNQASKTGHSVFQSEVAFHNNMSATNINFEGLYQGINVTELLSNVTSLGNLNALKNKYRTLMNTSEKIETSLRHQAFYIHDLKIILTIGGANYLFPVTDGSQTKLMALSNENGFGIVHFLTWNQEDAIFQDNTGFSMKLKFYPTFVQKVILGHVDYVYMEQETTPSENEDHTHKGMLTFFDLNNVTHFTHKEFLTQGTIYLTSFELEVLHYQCLLFIDFKLDINIVCSTPEEEYHLHQSIKSEKAHIASVLTINGTTYMITTRGANLNQEARTVLWQFNPDKSNFESIQTMFEKEPIYLSTISTPYGHYLAVASAYARATVDFGQIVIRRFNEETNTFSQWQNIKIKTPTKTEFVLLPTGELVLYILTENPVAPFSVHVYEGISGFSKKIMGTVIPNVIDMNQFTINKEHFLALRDDDEIIIIQALFKGTSI